MDDGEAEVSDHLTGNSSNTLRAPPKFEDPPLDDLSKGRKARGHDSTPTITQVLSCKTDDHGKPSGNRVAVRKYREKKKAQSAYMEEEVRKLTVLNHGLIKKLQHQADLEAEVVRLRSLLFVLKVKLDKEAGISPFYKRSSNGTSSGCSDHD